MRSIYGTRSSQYWDSRPAKFDVLNLRAIFDSSNEWGFPDLEPTDFVPEMLAAWHDPRQRAKAAGVGAVHFFLDDYRFESAFSAPERTLGRVTGVGAALTPDFSLWRDMPRAAQLWQVYRSRWCGAFWQHHGVKVIPTVCWAREDTYDFCFDGLPQGGVVAVSSLGVRASDEDRELFVSGLAEMGRRVRPSTVLAYGRLRGAERLLDVPLVREYPTHWDKQREAV